MMEREIKDKIKRIMSRDSRYDSEAYRFVSEALNYTICFLNRGHYADEVRRHVSGTELLDGIREYGLKKFGPMTRMVLEHWGVSFCEDFGEIVFNLVDEGILKKTETDRREDFRGGYSFHDAFDKPFEV